MENDTTFHSRRNADTTVITETALAPVGRFGRGILFIALCVTVPAWSATKEHVDVSIDDQKYSLEIVTEQPAGAVPDGGWPIVLITHGAPGSSSYADVGPDSLERWVRFFSARGYYTVAIARRGYATSDGPPAEPDESCAKPAPQKYLDAQADDLVAVAKLIGRRAEADARRVLAIDHSVGGASVLALNGRIDGLSAIISVAGGVYHWQRNIAPAQEFDRFVGCERYRAALVEAYAHYGALASTPSLWIYAANDDSFDTDLVGGMAKVWQSTDAASEPEVVILPPVDYSHRIFIRDEGPQVMGDSIDKFLQANDLSAPGSSLEADIKRCLPIDLHPSVQGFLATQNHRALVIPEDSTDVFYEGDFRSLDAAIDEALADCTLFTGSGCRILATDRQIIADSCLDRAD